MFQIEPSSFSTLCTEQCKQELIGFLLSLSIHHRNARVYVICDNKTKQYIEESTPYPKLDIRWYIELDKYSNYNRAEMESRGLWGDFQMEKANIIEKALEKETDTLLIDSDTIILDKLYINNNKELGVSPQFIKDENVKEVGYYNGGMLWTNQKSLPEKWKLYTKTSRYYDQASIENLVKIYNYFEFGENYNLQTWRFILGVEPANKIASYINVKNNKVYYKDEPLKFIHTHFNSNRFKQVNDFFIFKLTEARRFQELAIIYRVINNKWILQIPKQPMNGLWRHNNDSYRELAFLMMVNNKDVEIEYNTSSGHCWLKPNILTYDRPTLEWVNKEVYNSTLFLLGNGDVDKEGLELKNKGIKNIKEWIFWPRKPMLVEKILDKYKILLYNERKIESIFIGNIENNVQNTYRNSDEWKNVITEYHCTKGLDKKFTHEEYLMKIRSARYGLCLRGYGSKCHREVELMAFGTVPIITKEVSITSYYDKPIENIHYIYVNTPEELKYKIKNITIEQWNNMSQACYQWYQKNIHSKICWKNMIEYIIYN
jgi:hypothetical protein